MRLSFSTALSIARGYAPLTMFVALALLALRDAGSGIGLVAGAVFALALALYALLFGDQQKKPFSPIAARIVLAAGLGLATTGAVFPEMQWASEASEAGAFAATVAGAQLLFAVLIGRVSALHEGDAS